MKPLFIFMGLSSEYVLTPLANYCRDQGQECLEVDLAEKQLTLSEWYELSKRKTVFITSAHFDVGKHKAEYAVPYLNKWLQHLIAPLDLIEILNPIKSVYVPHDLMSHLVGDEWKYIDQFDLFLAPHEEYPIFNDFTRVENTGWIKYNSNSNTLPHDFAPRKKIIFISLFEHLRSRYGLEGVYEYFLPLLDEHTSIKLPLWGDIEIAEAYFKERGPWQVCNSAWNTIELIQKHDVVISNGSSSTLLESIYLGKRTICLESAENTDVPLYQRRHLGSLPELEFFSYYEPKNAPCIKSFLAQNKSQNNSSNIRLKPFQFEKAYNLIMEGIDN